MQAHVKELAPLELGGPLFEQCRARKNKKPTVGMEESWFWCLYVHVKFGICICMYLCMYV